MVKRRNGKVPSGRALALTLEAVAAGYGVVVDVSPRALQKEHDRFVKSATGKRFDASGPEDAATAFYVLQLPPRLEGGHNGLQKCPASCPLNIGNPTQI